MGVEGHCFGDPDGAGSVFLRDFQQLQANLAHTGMDQPNLPGYSVGYINFAPFLIGTPVIDTYQFKLAIPGVHDAHDRPKGKVRVGSRQCFTVESLAVGSLLPVKVRSIPAGVANPGLDGPNRLTQVSNKRSFHSGRNEKHQWHPSNCSPDHKEWSFHSVVFLLQTSRKV